MNKRDYEILSRLETVHENVKMGFFRVFFDLKSILDSSHSNSMRTETTLPKDAWIGLDWIGVYAG